MEEKRYQCENQMLKKLAGFVKSMRNGVVGGIIHIILCVLLYFVFVR